MSKIRIANGPYRGRERGLVDKPVTIGRDAEAGLQILDRSASRFHCEVFPVGGMWFVRDMESKNGTSINDEKLMDEELLRAGDVIKIGTTEMIFETGTAASDDDSSDRIRYQDDPEMLSNTLEFRVDELADLSEPAEEALVPSARGDGGKAVRILYQVGRILVEADRVVDLEARVLDCLVQQLPAECAVVFRRDPSSGKLVPNGVRTSAPGIQPVISRSIVKKTFTENKAVHSANALEDERFARNQSISSKQIRSVVCVPLVVGGSTRGVVYLSRGQGDSPFDQSDLELASAVALQLSQAQYVREERRKHRVSIVQTVSAMVRALEGRAACVGAGERCARAACAVALAMRLPDDSRERLYMSGLLHHFPRLTGDAATASRILDTIDDLEPLLPLVRAAYERVDGNGPLRTLGEELDTEARILGATTAFAARIAADPGADPQAVIETLTADAGFDANITQILAACHLDGSLYKRPDVPGASLATDRFEKS
jgi:HD-GYP domain-containing protein (c-di-GMP phosphodiesterase class II)